MVTARRRRGDQSRDPRSVAGSGKRPVQHGGIDLVEVAGARCLGLSSTGQATIVHRIPEAPVQPDPGPERARAALPGVAPEASSTPRESTAALTHSHT